MSRSGPDTLPDVRKDLPMSGSGRKDLLDVREWSGGPPGCPGVVGRPFRMSRSGPDTLQDVQKVLLDVRE